MKNQTQFEELRKISDELYDLSVVSMSVTQELTVISCAFEDRPLLTYDSVCMVFSALFDRAKKVEERLYELSDTIFEVAKTLDE